MISDGGKVISDGRRDGAQKLFLEPVAPNNPFEDALAQLARAIRIGAVAVGEKFPPERELSERLGVSRTTVREAIRGLEQAGYVTTRRGRFGGTFVLRDEATSADRDRRRALGAQMSEMLDFRLAIEPGAAALAAERADADLVAQMRNLSAEMEGADATEFARRNCRLHILFAEAADCAPLLKAVTTVEMKVMDVLLGMPKVSKPMVRSHDQHSAIIDAIAAGDSRAARDAVEVHLSGSQLLLRELGNAKKTRK